MFCSESIKCKEIDTLLIRMYKYICNLTYDTKTFKELVVAAMLFSHHIMVKSSNKNIMHVKQVFMI